MKSINKINKFRIIVVLLTIVLIAVGVYTITSSKSKTDSKTIPVSTVGENIKEIPTEKEIIVEKLKNVNKLDVLECVVTTQTEFSDREVNDNDPQMSWLKKKFDECSSKTIRIESKFKCTFTYNMEQLYINSDSSISLSKNRLGLHIEFIENATSEDIGLFSSDFSTQEINSINKRIQDLSYNTVLSNTDLRNRAMEEVKNNIDSIVGINLEFDVATYDVIEQNDSLIKNVSIGE